MSLLMELPHVLLESILGLLDLTSVRKARLVNKEMCAAASFSVHAIRIGPEHRPECALPAIFAFPRACSMHLQGCYPGLEDIVTPCLERYVTKLQLTCTCEQSEGASCGHTYDVHAVLPVPNIIIFSGGKELQQSRIVQSHWRSCADFTFMHKCRTAIKSAGEFVPAQDAASWSLETSGKAAWASFDPELTTNEQGPSCVKYTQRIGALTSLRVLDMEYDMAKGSFKWVRDLTLLTSLSFKAATPFCRWGGREHDDDLAPIAQLPHLEVLRLHCEPSLPTQTSLPFGGRCSLPITHLHVRSNPIRLLFKSRRLVPMVVIAEEQGL